MSKEKLIDKFDELISDYTKDVQEEGYKSKYSYQIKKKVADKLNDEVSRMMTILEIDNFVEDYEKSTKIEESVFEYSLIYSRNHGLSENLIFAVYKDKIKDIISNLNPDSSIKNDYLLEAIKSNEVDAKKVGYMSPSELFPKKWERLIQKREYQKNKAENLASTDLYKCYKCGERKCKVTQMQTRSADEPITIFVNCLVCGYTFKK